MTHFCVVSSLQDGMNLVAKEFAARDDETGVLVLSALAGAAQEFKEALAIKSLRHSCFYASHERDDLFDRESAARRDAEMAAEGYRMTVEAAPAAMIMVNVDGTLALANAPTERLLGYRLDELVGQAVARFSSGSRFCSPRSVTSLNRKRPDRSDAGRHVRCRAVRWTM